MALWTTLLLLAAAPGDRPAARRLRELVARSPALSDPASFVHSPHAAHGARAVASRPHAGSSRGRALHDTCDMPFQIVEEGERCTEPNAGVAVLECKEPLKCIYGRCKKVKEGDHCTTDAQCDGTGSNIDLVCVKGKCGHLLEAGETCTDDAQCFSNKCGTTGVCSGLKQGEKCEYLGGGDNVLSYQNPCDKGLHCAVKNSEEGEQLATCEPPVSTGGVCFGYTIRTDAIAPDWFYPAYVSAVYAACDAGHVCELVKFHPNGENGQPDAGLWQYHGLCRRLLATPPGETCHSDSVCAPPYACIHSKCTSTELTCGDAALIIDPMDTDAHAVALLHGCATNERCSCPGGVGHCYAIHDECTAEEARLVKCMEQHKCPWVDFGQTQCADDACEDEQIAYECCKYRAPQFSANVDWAAMKYVFDMDVHESCEHIVTGMVHGLKRGERVILELNHADDLTVNREGPFEFSKHTLHHLDPYNVTVTMHPEHKTCRVEHGSGVMRDDVHNVVINCGWGGGSASGGGAGGAIAAAILIPLFACCACVGLAAVYIGRNTGGGPMDGLSVLARAAGDLPRHLPQVSLPQFPGRGGGGGGGGGDDIGVGNYTGLFSGGGSGMGPNQADTIVEPIIPQAQVVDAATGQPVLQATAVA